MKAISLLVMGLALSAAPLAAQTVIPAGTVIPVELRSSINVRKSNPGQTIQARVAQDVPLYNGSRIKAGSRVTGEILTVTPAQDSHPATIALRFDKVDLRGQMTPIVTDLRAVASPFEVYAAQMPTSDTKPDWEWTVSQVGGNDAVYRAAGTVDSGVTPVGKSVYAKGNWGVLDELAAEPEGHCRGAVAGNDNPQALWVFSHDACGVYGYDATIADAGRTNPQARIVLATNDPHFQLRSGSALLLRVNGVGTPASTNDSASK